MAREPSFEPCILPIRHKPFALEGSLKTKLCGQLELEVPSGSIEHIGMDSSRVGEELGVMVKPCPIVNNDDWLSSRLGMRVGSNEGLSGVMSLWSHKPNC